MVGKLCALIFFLNCLVLCTAGISVENAYRFLLQSQLHNQSESPKILFRRFNSTGATYLFIAYLNKICQFNTSSLSLLNERITGPKNCSTFCFIPGGSCVSCNQYFNRPLTSGYSSDNGGMRLTDTYVKSWSTSNFEYIEQPFSDMTLVNISPWKESTTINNDLNAIEDALYVCYNVFLGFCERLQLTNISIVKPWERRSSLVDFYSKRISDIPIPVVNWNASLSSTITVDSSYVYVGLEQDQFQDNTLVDLDPLSIRLRDFDYASKEPSEKSSLRFLENDFRIKYKFSFQYTLEQVLHESAPHHNIQHIYFVAQQPNVTEPGMLETRIARICSGDKFFHSYIDLELSCENCLLRGQGHTQKKFGALHLAARGTVGVAAAAQRFSRLRNSKAVPKWRQPIPFSEDFNNVLLVAFASQSIGPIDYSPSWNPNFGARHQLIRGTAIAFYTLAEIDVWFGLVTQNCLTGKTSTGPPHFLPGHPKKCNMDDMLLPSLKLNSYCPKNPMNWPISGSIQSERLSAPPVLLLDADATGIAITRAAEEFTILVVTTDEGELAKYTVEEDGGTRLIASKQLTPRRRPLRGLTLDDTGLVAFAISDEKVYRVELQDCSSVDNCGACLAQRDPHCGWCLVKGVCTHKAACNAHWLSYRTPKSKCPNIILVDPPGMDVTHRKGLSSFTGTLRLQPSAPLSSALTDTFLSSSPASTFRRGWRHLFCVFRYRYDTDMGEEEPSRLLGSIYAQKEANFARGSNDVRCSLPEPDELPTLHGSEQFRHTLVWLEVAEWSTASENLTYPLVAGVFTIYDCRRFADCETCLSRLYDCVWHLTQSRCLPSTSLPPPSSSSNRSDFAPICIKSNCTCPGFAVDPPITTGQELKPVSVVARVSGTQLFARRFSCFENCTGRWTPGVFDPLNSTVTCTFDGIALNDVIRPVENSSGSDDIVTWHPNPLNFAIRGLVMCEIGIRWHNDHLPNQPKMGHRLTNLEAASLEIFECGRMAPYCDSCLALPPRFSCVWCPANATAADMGICSHAEHCLLPTGPESSCSHLRLFQVIPENATLSGQVPITIRGINLGGELKDLEITAVMTTPNIEPIACTVLPEGFQPPRQISCILQPWEHGSKHPSTPLEGYIMLRQGNSHEQNASLPFTFLSPKVESFSPLRGPIAGGTHLRIFGSDLNVGASVMVVLDLDANGGQYDANCKVVYLSANLITCRTGAVDPALLPLASELESGGAVGIHSSVTVFHDRTLTRASPLTFVYTPNPAIRTVSKTLLFFGGGTTIHVYGQYLDVVERPQIVFYRNGMEFIEVCQSMLGHLSCLSPSLTLVENRRRRRRDLVDQSNTTVRPITDASVLHKIHSFEYDDESRDDLSKTSDSILVPYGFIMDQAVDVLVYGVFSVLPNPEVFAFAEGRRIESFTPLSSSSFAKEASATLRGEGTMDGDYVVPNLTSERALTLQDRHLLRFHGNFEALANVPDLQTLEQLLIIVVTEPAENVTNRACKLTVVNADEIRCELNRKGLIEGEDYPVVIQFGRYLTSRPGVLQFRRLGPIGGRDRAVIVASSLMGVVTLVACLFLAMWCRSRRTKRDLEKRYQIRWAEQEKCVARAFKNDFIELQTHVDELVQDLNKGSLPIRDYQSYCLFSLFPEYHLSLVQPCDPHDMPPRTSRSDLGDAATLRPHPLVSVFEVPVNVQKVADRGIFLFNRLLHNHHFLCLLIHAIESNRNIDARAKSQIASLLSITLHADMRYFTQIILSLIADLLRKSHDHAGGGRLLTAFRRAESVVAKMLSNWFTFLLYNFIKEHAAEHLFILYRALRQQINTGPQDAVTGLARYTLDAATILKSDLLSRPITLLIVDPEDMFGSLCPAKMPVRVLSCDTVTQAKEKILDAIYRNTPYRSQLRPTDVHLILAPFEQTTDLYLMDWDLNVRRECANASVDGPPYRLNCLSDYKLNDNDMVAIVRARASFSPTINGGNTPPACTALGDHSCPTPNGSVSPSYLTQPPYLPNGHQHVHLNIHPTGPPSAHLWYHLDRPGTTNLQAAEKSGWTREEKDERRPCRRLSLFSNLRSQGTSSVLSDSSSPLTQLPCGGLDARSLRRWLATEAVDASITKGVRISRRRTRRSLRRASGPRSSCSATYETVELDTNRTEGPDDVFNRPMAKLPCEIFLNRLLRTRVSVAKYMEKVVELIFSVVMDSQSPPLCIKFLFDFLDSQAETLGIHDPGILHAWKTNCLHLRFWNQILINLDYIFDIPLLRNTALERSFHSFSQAITYACSPVLDKVTMDSPINKALFSSDIERHWLRVKRYLAEIKVMPAISLYDMNVSLCQHSKNHKTEFNVSWALYELYTRYVTLCYDTLITGLRTALSKDAPSANISYNMAGSAESYPYPYGTDSLRGGFPAHQTAEWNPRYLLQTLQEVNSCMMAVANGGSNGSLNTPKSPAASPQSTVSQFLHQQSSSSLGGHSSMRSAVPHSERRLPPLPTPL